MLIRSPKILTFNGDNATLNDKQTVYLHALPNSFIQVNGVCCFNHMMQLSAKRLLKPFTSSAMANNTKDDDNVSQPTSGADVTLASGDGVNFDLLNKEIDDDLVEDPGDIDDDEDDNEGDEELLESTATVRVALDKMH
jgi:hypothetical protein